MIRMINQTGDGYADAYSEHDAKSYEDKGWSRYYEEAVIVATPEQPEEVKPLEIASPERKKPGPKPRAK